MEINVEMSSYGEHSDKIQRAKRNFMVYSKNSCSYQLYQRMTNHSNFLKQGNQKRPFLGGLGIDLHIFLSLLVLQTTHNSKPQPSPKNASIFHDSSGCCKVCLINLIISMLINIFLLTPGPIINQHTITLQK